MWQVCSHSLSKRFSRLISTRTFASLHKRRHSCSTIKMASEDNDKPTHDIKSSGGFSTQSIHVGHKPENWPHWPLVAPISLSTTFKQFGPGDYEEFDYSRAGNPTRKALEECIAALDGNKHAICFASGCAALCGVVYLLKAGDHILCMDDVYGGTYRFFVQLSTRMGLEVDFVEATDANNVAAAITLKTKLVWIETPTNPTLKMVDIAAVTKVVRDRSDGAIIAVDNTFMSPYFQRPSDYGVDLVVHSLTKYINGHTDVVMGSVSTSDKDLADRLNFILKSFGGCPSPFDCYLVSRSIKTLSLRMKQHHDNGLAVANFLCKHPQVTSVIHPGLPSHPQYELGRRQMSGYSGMLSFYIKGGVDQSKAFLKNLQLFSLAESLGGVDSLAELPSLMTHASIDAAHREAMGVTDNLIRLSVGLEDQQDLIADLDQALNAAAAV